MIVSVAVFAFLVAVMLGSTTRSLAPWGCFREGQQSCF
jgi:hypothetical protein